VSLLLLVHQRLFLAGLLLALIVGIWGLLTYFRKGLASGGFRSTMVMTEILFVVEGLLGMALYVGGRRPHDVLHILYGVLLVIALPIGLSYTTGREARREPLVFGVIGLFMVGLAIRALTTAK
jgi:mannitol-specific phosphotransferase system IIBC component